MRGKLAPALTAGTLSLMCAASGPALADAPKCEPGKLAAKYPSLAGKTIKIGTDGETPPYAMRDPKGLQSPDRT